MTAIVLSRVAQAARAACVRVCASGCSRAAGGSSRRSRAARHCSRRPRCSAQGGQKDKRPPTETRCSDSVSLRQTSRPTLDDFGPMRLPPESALPNRPLGQSRCRQGTPSAAGGKLSAAGHRVTVQFGFGLLPSSAPARAPPCREAGDQPRRAGLLRTRRAWLVLTCRLCCPAPAGSAAPWSSWCCRRSCSPPRRRHSRAAPPPPARRRRPPTLSNSCANPSTRPPPTPCVAPSRASRAFAPWSAHRGPSAPPSAVHRPALSGALALARLRPFLCC